VGTEPSTAPGNDEAATVAEPVASSRRLDSRGGTSGDLPSSTSNGSRVTSVITPRDTLHVQEIARTRTFTVLVIVFASLVIGTLTIVGGNPSAKRLFMASLTAIVVASAWLRWQVRKDEGYTVARATAAAYVTILGAFTGIWFFGVFSPAPMILPFGIAFFSIGQSRAAVTSVYATCAGLLLLLTLLVALGVVPDQGMIHTVGLSRVEQCVFVLLMQTTLFVTFFMQRQARQATLAAIEQHDRVVRSLAHRDALLAEARHDLDQALQAGGMGRWSEEVLGSFRLGRVIGRGAMGEVYEAERVEGGEPAAVKLLHPHVLAQADLAARFVREARIVSSLTDVHIVRVLEVSAADSRVPYLAMERLDGMDLTDYLREHKRMSLRNVLSMIRQVGTGLDAARSAGVVHRDLKPRNLFLAKAGGQQFWKILDFGVARITGEETLTQDQIVGTPNYMAPEQANGGEVTHRSDLFAMGVIAYRTLTGRPAFEGETTAEILYKVVHTMPPRPTSVATLPAQIDLALAIALAKSPDDRFESAAEFAHALDAAARGRLDASLRGRAEKLLAKLDWADE
jgi:eukaryotic-like serine/threonine-protein kinase